MNVKPVSVRPNSVRPGRRRSEQSRRAILASTWELVNELGYSRLSIEGVAARAGTGKQTIYRWWPSKADLLYDVLATKADLHVQIPDQGSYAADLRAFLSESFALGRKRQVADALRALMAQAQTDPVFGDRFRAGFLQRRRDALGVILERARARGDLPPTPSAGTVCDLVFGTIWYRLMASRQPLDRRLVEELVTTLVGSDAGRSRRALQRTGTRRNR